MKLITIKKILLDAQRTESNGVIITPNHSVPFEFYSGPGYCAPDIISTNETEDIISILSECHQYHIEATAVTNIDIHPHRD